MTVITLTYAAAIRMGWPHVNISIQGDGSDYSKISTLPGSPALPSQAELDAWLSARATDQLWKAIKAKRDRVSEGGVSVGGHWFHSDSDSRIKYLGLVGMGAAMPSGIQWKTMTGDFVTMSPTLAAQIFQAVSVLDMTAFAVAQAHKSAMEAGAFPQMYSFSAGWPATYART